MCSLIILHEKIIILKTGWREELHVNVWRLSLAMNEKLDKNILKASYPAPKYQR
jgi:hypothetical protein